MKEKLKNTDAPTAVYNEETLRIPILTLVITLALVITPLVWSISRIDADGLRASDISKYTALIQSVGKDTDVVRTLLSNQTTEVSTEVRKVTLIVPELIIVDEAKSEEVVVPLNINLKGIYWSSSNPLVDIDNETYYVGDKVQGYMIVKISKTAVRFKAKDGTIVVKDLYENLFQNKK